MGSQKILKMFTSKLARSTQMLSQMNRMFSVKVGDKMPSITVPIIRYGADGFKSEKFDAADYFKGRHIVLVGYPGAFTPTCMATHIPQYIESAHLVKEQGVDEIIAMSVNDPFVVTAFAEHL